jgi:hypothetical protein
MRRLYVKFATTLQGALIGAGLFAFVTLHPDTTDYIAQKALKDNGIRYERIEGTLFTGFDLYGVAYRDVFKAAHVAIHYNIFRLLSPRPTIEEVLVERADLYPLRIEFPKSESAERNTTVALPPIAIERVVATAFRTHVPDTVTADLKAEDLLYFRENVTIPKIEAKIRSPWANGRLRGSFDEMVLKATLDAMVAGRYRRLALERLESLPRRLHIDLLLDEDHLEASTKIPGPLRTKEANLTIGNANVSFRYLFGPNYMEAEATYRLASPAAEGEVRQNLLLTPSPLAYATRVEGRIVQSAWKLPSDRFEADAAGGPDVLTANLRYGPFSLNAYSTDFDRFTIYLRARAKPHRLDYLVHLPKIFSNQTVSMESNATLTLLPEPSLKGVILLDGNYSGSRSFVEWHPQSLLVKALVTPKNIEGGIWEVVPPMFKTDIHTYLYYSPDNKLLNVSSAHAYLTLFEKERRVKGWANIGSLTLDVKGDIEPDDSVKLDFHTKIPSLYALMEELGIHSDVTVDAEVESSFQVVLSDWLSLRYETSIPWYLVQPDSQTVYYGLDSTLVGGIKGEELSIDRYDIGFQDRRFKQTRPSYFHFDEDFDFHIDRLAILDTGALTGRYLAGEKRGDFRFRAQNMHYRGPEGNVTLDSAVDINLTRETLDVEGEVELLEGVISYMPPKSYTVTDDDIVIIQDIKEPSHTKKSIDLHIYSKKPIRYEIPMLKVDFRPDVTIWKEPMKPTVLLGIVRIDDGTIDVEEKHFDIEPSEIYFWGAYPPNPYLDLRILYTLDFNRFHIYISHTLSDPVFLFSSEPPMSQNDIMSYILFGTPANESFQGGRGASGDVAAMLLGLGIKNAIGAATGLRFDTFNILNTEEGGFGVEIGKRIGKRFRIIYRNDTLSSFILQYTLSRSVRLDIDVRETGQGINILYVKDFRGPEFLDRRIEIIEPK